MGNVQVI